ncbi:hypothetical protein [Ulvibacterium sp.]|nr:hypothetical protein [Ulvibacterium sp.]
MRDLAINMENGTEKFKSLQKQISLKYWVGWAGGYGISQRTINVSKEEV